jgi:S-adenosylmethionine:tRNA ribosyltransferase-isomerase
MLTAEFDYELPEASIASHGMEPRDAARLLVALDGIEHRHVRDLPSYLRPGDVVVVNDTRVLPARLLVRRPSGGGGEVLLLEEAGDGWWEALVRPSAKIRPGTVVVAGEVSAADGGLEIEVGDDLGEGRRIVRPMVAPDKLLDSLERYGQMPLPPYLGDVTMVDPERYQTVYARRAASAAAPTAGLHLTPELLLRMEAAGARVVRIELIVGLGTFRPISVERVEDHVMHSERYRIDPDVWKTVAGAGRVIGIGTTTVRALESAAASGVLSGGTDLFIRRPYEWQVVDLLMTNFHLPRSSLLVMIDAFVGPRWRDLYREALDADYRFLSFGDAMLLARTGRDEA